MILQTFSTDIRPLVSDLSESERNSWFLDPTGNVDFYPPIMLSHLIRIISQVEMTHDLSHLQVIQRSTLRCRTNRRKEWRYCRR